jgi:hypothetical protein
MQKTIIAFIVLIIASFIVSFLFNDFHIELKNVAGEFIRMLGICIIVGLLLKTRTKK